LNLYDYQHEAVESVSAAFKKLHRRVLLVSPTGTGKTHIANEMVRRTVERGRRVLFMAHRRELIFQTRDRFRLTHETGIIMGDEKPNHAAPVQVACVDTLTRRQWRGEEPALIIADEAHLSVAPKWRRVLDMFPESRWVGLTATPYRANGAGLGCVYDSLIVALTTTEAERRGVIVPPEVYAVNVPLGKMAVKGHEFVPNSQALLASIGDVTRTYKAVADGQKAIVFGSTREHSRQLAAAFGGVHIDADTPQKVRDDAFKAFKAGSLRVICNCSIIVEGYDVPDAAVCVLAFPTRSLGRFVQMVGRAARAANGKRSYTLIDAGRNVERLGWPSEDHSPEFSLHGTIRDVAKRGLQLHLCRQCYRSYKATARECPYCGFVREIKELKFASATTEKVVRKPKDASILVTVPYLTQMRKEARAKGYKDGWALHRFNARFGRWPTLEEQRAA
jgi:superfamily II DNA or RNA helicase